MQTTGTDYNTFLGSMILQKNQLRVGSIFEIVLPAKLAYGDNGSGDAIAPGATLIFEVELVDVTNPLTPSG